MTQEQTYKVLDEMLINPKSKTFLNHLVKSYLPVGKVQKVFNKPTTQFKCALSNKQLFSMQEILDGVKTTDFKDKLIKSLTITDNKTIGSPIKDLIGDKELGLTSKETNTYLSLTTFNYFYDWVISKSLTGDKHINWLLGSIRRSSFLERAENLKDEAVSTKASDLKMSRGATFSLGDANDALAKLKAKMEADGR